MKLFLIYLYRNFFRYVTRFLAYLLAKNILWLGLPLSILSRKVKFREFWPIKKTYSSITELNSIVEDEILNQSSNLIIKRIKRRDTKDTKDRKKNIKEQLLSNKRVLFIYTENVKLSKNNISGNFTSWINTAKEAGCKTDKFIAEKVSYTPFQTHGNDAAARIKTLEVETKKLLHKISQFSPDLIFMDANYSFDEFTINRDTVNSMRSVTSAKIVGILDDMFSDDSFMVAKLWASFMDIVFFSNIGISNRNVKNIIYVKYPVDPYAFYPAKKKKDTLFFSGIGNIPRYLYIFIAKRYCQVNLIPHYIQAHNREKKFCLSKARFEKYVRESNAVLEATARSSVIRPTGGRTHTAIACKTLLIMEKSEYVHGMLAPFVHYIPYDTKKELEIAIQFSIDSKELVNKITNNSFDFYQKYYNADKIWQQIFYHSFDRKWNKKKRANKKTLN
jgi:hypothetical protein